jgi:hypothetical protein
VIAAALLSRLAALGVSIDGDPGALGLRLHLQFHPICSPYSRNKADLLAIFTAPANDLEPLLPAAATLNPGACRPLNHGIGRGKSAHGDGEAGPGAGLRMLAGPNANEPAARLCRDRHRNGRPAPQPNRHHSHLSTKRILGKVLGKLRCSGTARSQMRRNSLFELASRTRFELVLPP